MTASPLADGVAELSTPRAATAPPHTAALAWKPTGRIAAGTLWRLAGLLIFAGYWWIYFATPVPAFVGADGRPQDRFGHHWELVAAPETLVRNWIGGDWNRTRFVDRFGIGLFASLLLATSYELGQLLLKTFCFRAELTAKERIVFAMGLGMQGMSLLTLALGLAGQLHNASLFWLLLMVIVMVRMLFAERRGDAACPDHLHVVSQTTKDSQQNSAADDWLSKRWLWLGLPFLVWLALAACLPPWHFDARVYHLQVPKEWLEVGRIGFLPHNAYGNMPLGAEMHALLAMALTRGDELSWWHGALIGKVVMSSFAPLTALALYAFGARLFSRTAGIVAAVLYVSTPWVTFVSATGLNEGASAFYWLLAIFAALLWSRANDRRLLVLSGWMIGAAISCKYPALLFLAVPLALFVAWRSRERFAAMAINLSLLVAVTVASCGLWLGKNWVLTGNPTYPLLVSVFGGETRTPEKDEQWRRAHAPPVDAAGARFSLTHFVDAGQRLLWRSSGLSPLLIPFLMLACGIRKQRRLVLGLGAFLCFTIAAWWLATHRFDRFLVPLLPLAALLGGAGLASLRSAEARRLGAAALLIGVISNGLVTTSRVLGDNRVCVSLAELRADEPQAADGYFSRVHPVHRLLNRLDPKPAGVLLVGDSRPFDLEVPTHYNTCFDSCLFEQLLRDRSPDECRVALRERNISHIYISWSDIACLRQPGEYGFTNWVTPQRVHEQLVRDQRLFQKVEIGLPAEVGELFVVIEPVIPSASPPAP